MCVQWEHVCVFVDVRWHLSALVVGVSRSVTTVAPNPVDGPAPSRSVMSATKVGSDTEYIKCELPDACVYLTSSDWRAAVN